MRKHLAILAAVTVLLPAPSLAQAIRRPTARQERSLELFLRNYLKRPYIGVPNVRYYASSVQLATSGPQETLVYLVGGLSCGSGGCITLVLAPEGRSYRVVGRFTITWPPIRVLAKQSHGWHDIAVRMHGGGIRRPCEGIFTFDGTSYPNRPSLRPLSPRAKPASGTVAIPSNAPELAKRLGP